LRTLSVCQYNASPVAIVQAVGLLEPPAALSMELYASTTIFGAARAEPLIWSRTFTAISR